MTATFIDSRQNCSVQRWWLLNSLQGRAQQNKNLRNPPHLARILQLHLGTWNPEEATR
jgi:hypothetical protein